MRRHIADEADTGLYLPLSLAQDLQPMVDVPPRPQLLDGVVDALLLRVFISFVSPALTFRFRFLPLAAVSFIVCTS
jgi:mediator of RNA polymerase II transcription subunit 14